MVWNWPPKSCKPDIMSDMYEKKTHSHGGDQKVKAAPKACGAFAVEIDIPTALAATIQRLSPVCKNYGMFVGCKKGRSCRNRHGDDVDERALAKYVLPHTSRDPAGNLTSRPPLTEGLICFFEKNHYRGL